MTRDCILEKKECTCYRWDYLEKFHLESDESLHLLVCTEEKLTVLDI